MRKIIKYSIPLALILVLVIGLNVSKKANAIPIPEPDQTTVIATGFSDYGQIKISIVGVPLDCTTCWECHWDQFISPSSTVYFPTGEQYIDYRGTNYDSGRISVWYWDLIENTWAIIGSIGFEDCTLSGSGTFLTNISFDYDNLAWAEPVEE